MNAGGPNILGGGFLFINALYVGPIKSSNRNKISSSSKNIGSLLICATKKTLDSA